MLIVGYAYFRFAKIRCTCMFDDKFHSFFPLLILAFCDELLYFIYLFIYFIFFIF